VNSASAGRKEVFLLAYPAGHSISPAMHAAAFASLGSDASYHAWEVPPAELARVIAGFRESPSFLGANVTVPHKRGVMPLLDELGAEAKSIGAVNTIVRRGGRLIGSNTDAAGFARALGELLPPEAGRIDARALVLGAGGSAPAVVWALLNGLVEAPAAAATAGASESTDGAGSGPRFTVGIHARRQEAAEALVADLGGRVVTARDLRAWMVECDVLINTTPVGMQGGGLPEASPSPLPLSTLPLSAVVLDLVYRPAVTPLLEEARRTGLSHANGLAMLVWQGAASFETWTGSRAPVDVMRAAAAAALAT